MSPDRGKFQIESYVKRCEADGKIPRADYLEIMEASRDKEKTKFLDLELLTSIRRRCRFNDVSNNYDESIDSWEPQMFKS